MEQSKRSLFYVKGVEFSFGFIASVVLGVLARTDFLQEMGNIRKENKKRSVGENMTDRSCEQREHRTVQGSGI